jgi:hypothetical protein
VLFAARFALLGANVLRFHLALMLFQIVRLEEDRTDHVLARAGGSLHRPRFRRRHDLAVLQIERFHHLADESVRQHNRRIAVVVGQFEGKDGQVRHLPHGRRSDDKIAIVAVASAFDHGEVVALLGRDVAQSRSDAHDVYDHAGQFGSRKIKRCLPASG